MNLETVKEKLKRDGLIDESETFGYGQISEGFVFDRSIFSLSNIVLFAVNKNTLSILKAKLNWDYTNLIMTINKEEIKNVKIRNGGPWFLSKKVKFIYRDKKYSYLINKNKKEICKFFEE